jgi:hypothetical protein
VNEGGFQARRHAYGDVPRGTIDELFTPYTSRDMNRAASISQVRRLEIPSPESPTGAFTVKDLAWQKERSVTDHFLLRVPLMTRVEGRAFNTVDAHNQVVAEKGRVAIAKFGSPGTFARSQRLKAQIDQGTATFLILVTKSGARFLGYRSQLTSIHYGKPDSKLLEFAPPYYADLVETSELWFIAASPFLATALDGFRLSTNHRPVMDVITECRTSSMLVEKDA